MRACRSATEKLKAQLNSATVLSTVEGTVVEVNRNVSKSPTGNSQVLVHQVTITCRSRESFLSTPVNLSCWTRSHLTSKVHPDKTWDGKISYTKIIQK